MTLASLRVFCTVAELKSFTAAERLSPAMASKHVMHLERRLGTRLFNRTSRHVSLTETGALYFEQTRQTLDGLDEVEAAVSQIAVTPRGVLRLSAPVWMANPAFTAVLADYRARYPEVRFDIDLSGRPNKQIGYQLSLSEMTVKVHRSQVMHKMGARSLVDLVRMADKLGVSAARRNRPRPSHDQRPAFPLLCGKRTLVPSGPHENLQPAARDDASNIVLFLRQILICNLGFSSGAFRAATKSRSPR
jgi:hypothetical protein